MAMLIHLQRIDALADAFAVGHSCLFPPTLPLSTVQISQITHNKKGPHSQIQIVGKIKVSALNC